MSSKPVQQSSILATTVLRVDTNKIRGRVLAVGLITLMVLGLLAGLLVTVSSSPNDQSGMSVPDDRSADQWLGIDR